MESEEKKTFEPKSYNVKGLGEITRRANGDFVMAQADVNKFFNDNGLPEYQDFKKKENEVVSSFIEKAVGFLKDETIKDGRDTTLKAGLGNNRMDVTYKERVEGRNPRTGESTVHFGVVQFRNRQDVPASMKKEGGILEKYAKETEAAWNKRHNVK